MNLLIETLKTEIEHAKKTCTRCPRCLQVVTKWQSVYFKDGVFYHAKCGPR